LMLVSIIPVRQFGQAEPLIPSAAKDEVRVLPV